MVAMEQDRLLTESARPFTSQALESVSLRFVSTTEELTSNKLFSPEFVHQHFGDNETIFGYEDLKVTLNYSSVSMYLYPEISYSKDISKTDSDMKGDDIIQKLRDQLPIDQQNMLLESKDAFIVSVCKQKSFKPYGELITKFKTDNKQFELYKSTKSNSEIDDHLARIQSLALFYIDAAQYTDNTDEKWMNYFLYESMLSDEGDGSRVYQLAGYAALYRFYAYPSLERPRVAQILLLPQYRGGGNGAKLLQSIYRDLYTMDKILDITAEDPADNFIFLRDYVDCVNCATLPEFAPELLKQGFSEEMKIAAVKSFKINKRQARRVYEILRFKCTNVKNEAELKAYRIDVKRRLERPLSKSDNDWKKMNRALEQDEINQVAAIQLNRDQKIQVLQQLYDLEMEGYKKTIDRLKTFPNIF